jgi:hypothetical protein
LKTFLWDLSAPKLVRNCGVGERVPKQEAPQMRLKIAVASRGLRVGFAGGICSAGSDLHGGVPDWSRIPEQLTRFFVKKRSFNEGI